MRSLAQRMEEAREVITIPDDDENARQVNNENAQQARTDRNQKRRNRDLFISFGWIWNVRPDGVHNVTAINLLTTKRQSYNRIRAREADWGSHLPCYRIPVGG